VTINEIKVGYLNDSKDFGELRAFFDKRSWVTKIHGLIYTDKKWLREFQKNMELIGFSENATRNISYSE
jgi:hypothetical protein